MPRQFVLDEHLRTGRALWDIIQRHNIAGLDPIDVVRVGDETDLPLGTQDPELLLWAKREGRILITEDRRTMATHLAAHLAVGHYSPGVMTPRPGVSLPQLLQLLVLAAYASEPVEWENQQSFIP